MIYFIQESSRGLIKIGLAVDPQSRLIELQVGSPHTLTLLLVVDGDRDDERRLHRRFSRHRVRGEWFKPQAAVLHFMLQCAQACSVPPQPAGMVGSVSGYTAMVLQVVTASVAAVTTSSVSSSVGISRETARQLLSRLVRRGMIRRIRHGVFERIADGE